MENGVDTEKNVRYNEGSLSKSTFSTSTKRNEKRGIFEVACVASKSSLGFFSFNNLTTIKILRRNSRRTSFAS